MTIKRKRVNAGALVEVETDSTDTVDTLGVSDAINIQSAITAKFSNATTMKANAGLRIGMTQVRFDGDAHTDNRITIPETTAAPAGNAIDSNLSTSANQVYSSASSKVFVTVDFGSLQTLQIQARVGAGSGGGLLTVPNVVLQVSTDDISYVTVAGPTNISPGGEVDFDGGPQTYRYARIQADGVGSGGYLIEIHEIYSTFGTSTAQIKLISSSTQDSTSGTDLISEFTLSETTNITKDTELLLTGNGEFVTLVVISYTGIEFPISLSDITSIREEP